ncbi:MAG: MoaD/ThiS family protein [Planctomycetaceae bacterium]
MNRRSTIRVEFYGIPRLRAKRPALDVEAETVREALQQTVQVLPGLADCCTPDGGLRSGYLLSIDGVRFISDVTQELRPGQTLLLLSRDAGG